MPTVMALLLRSSIFIFCLLPVLTVCGPIPAMNNDAKCSDVRNAVDSGMDPAIDVDLEHGFSNSQGKERQVADVKGKDWKRFLPSWSLDYSGDPTRHPISQLRRDGEAPDPLRHPVSALKRGEEAPDPLRHPVTALKRGKTVDSHQEAPDPLNHPVTALKRDQEAPDPLRHPVTALKRGDTVDSHEEAPDPLRHPVTALKRNQEAPDPLRHPVTALKRHVTRDFETDNTGDVDMDDDAMDI